MSEWWTYRLTSFLLFSPRTYYRTIELYNLEIWPAQLVGLAIGLAIIALLVVQPRLLAIESLPRCSPPAGCGSGGRFTTSAMRRSIGWRRGLRRRSRSRRCFSLALASSRAGSCCRPAAVGCSGFAIALIVIIVVGYPLLAPLTGRSWTTAEVFGVAADPTALATVAVLALVRGRIRWLLLVDSAALVRVHRADVVGDEVSRRPLSSPAAALLALALAATRNGRRAVR